MSEKTGNAAEALAKHLRQMEALRNDLWSVVVRHVDEDATEMPSLAACVLVELGTRLMAKAQGGPQRGAELAKRHVDATIALFDAELL